MPDRADYLARVFLTRFHQLESASREEGGDTDDSDDTKRRNDLVAKILAVEEGVTDGRTVKLIASAIPPIKPNRMPSDREYQDLAMFLRGHLKL